MDEPVHVCFCCSIHQVPEPDTLCGQCEAESFSGDEDI